MILADMSFLIENNERKTIKIEKIENKFEKSEKKVLTNLKSMLLYSHKHNKYK